MKIAAEYEGREVKLNKPMKGDRKKYKVYVKNDKDNVVKVEFGDPNLEIKRDDPERRKNFRSRHKCDTDPRAKDKTTAKYWSCRFWESGTTVSELLNKKSSVFQELTEAANTLAKLANDSYVIVNERTGDLVKSFKNNQLEMTENKYKAWTAVSLKNAEEKLKKILETLGDDNYTIESK
jgi:hypothetical protein